MHNIHTEMCVCVYIHIDTCIIYIVYLDSKSLSIQVWLNTADCFIFRIFK